MPVTRRWAQRYSPAMRPRRDSSMGWRKRSKLNCAHCSHASPPNTPDPAPPGESPNRSPNQNPESVQPSPRTRPPQPMPPPDDVTTELWWKCFRHVEHPSSEDRSSQARSQLNSRQILALPTARRFQPCRRCRGRRLRSAVAGELLAVGHPRLIILFPCFFDGIEICLDL